MALAVAGNGAVVLVLHIARLGRAAPEPRCWLPQLAAQLGVHNQHDE